MAKNFLAAISWYLVLKDQYIKKVMRVDLCSQSLQVPSVLVHNQSNVMNQPTPLLRPGAGPLSRVLC